MCVASLLFPLGAPVKVCTTRLRGLGVVSTEMGVTVDLSHFQHWPHLQSSWRNNPDLEAVKLNTVAKVGVAPLPLSLSRNIYPRRCLNSLRFFVFNFQTAYEPVSHTKHHHVAFWTKPLHCQHVKQNFYWTKSQVLQAAWWSNAQFRYNVSFPHLRTVTQLPFSSSRVESFITKSSQPIYQVQDITNCKVRTSDLWHLCIHD
jgi:hypothetical protein